MGGEPGNEAHGGYTFCGVAALLLMNQTDVIDVPRLIVRTYYHPSIIDRVLITNYQ